MAFLARGLTFLTGRRLAFLPGRWTLLTTIFPGRWRGFPSGRRRFLSRSGAITGCGGAFIAVGFAGAILVAIPGRLSGAVLPGPIVGSGIGAIHGPFHLTPTTHST